MTQYQRLYFLLSLWYSNAFYIDLKVILCRIGWSLFQVHKPKYVEIIIFILAYFLLVIMQNIRTKKADLQKMKVNTTKI